MIVYAYDGLSVANQFSDWGFSPVKFHAFSVVAIFALRTLRACVAGARGAAFN